MDTTGAGGGGGIDVVFRALDGAASVLGQTSGALADVAGRTATLHGFAAAAGDPRVEAAIGAFLDGWERGAGHLARDAGGLARNVTEARGRYEALDRRVARAAQG